MIAFAYIDEEIKFTALAQFGEYWICVGGELKANFQEYLLKMIWGPFAPSA